ncbi:hypothetical protein F-S17_0073 [Faustovirus]|nr:hypothetical protein F-S17_0073 [Faustovirus]QJX72849.1 hypothetical protein F-VV57_0087 [Faustovirus]QJX73355.1 hypothetical protein F-VV63_0089 [Faustovirus]QJX73863.1 hypothetical protein F-E9_90 [Faustovirus]
MSPPDGAEISPITGKELTEDEVNFINNAKKMTAKHTCKLLAEYITWLSCTPAYAEHKRELENIAAKASQLSPYNYAAHLELEAEESADTFCFTFEYSDVPFVQPMFLPDASYQQDANDKLEMMFGMIACFWAHIYNTNKQLFSRLESIIGKEVKLIPDGKNFLNLMFDENFNGRVVFKIYIRRPNGDICIPRVDNINK